MRRSIYNHNTRAPHPVYGRAIQMLRQQAQMLMEQAYDAECRLQQKRSARYTAQAAAMNCAAAFLAECPRSLAAPAATPPQS